MIGAGAIGLSAVAALAGRGIDPIVVVGLQRRAPRARRASSAPTSSSTRPSGLPSTCGARSQKERWITKPAVVFECVGRPGWSSRSSTRARCGRGSSPPAAGTPATPSTARGHPQGRHDPVRRRPAPRGLVRHLDAICDGRSTPCPASARSSASTRSPRPSSHPPLRRPAADRRRTRTADRPARPRRVPRRRSLASSA